MGQQEAVDSYHPRMKSIYLPQPIPRTRRAIKKTEQQQPHQTGNFSGVGGVFWFVFQKYISSYSGSNNNNTGICDNHGQQQQQQQRDCNCCDGDLYHNRQRLYTNNNIRIKSNNHKNTTTIYISSMMPNHNYPSNPERNNFN